MVLAVLALIVPVTQWVAQTVTGNGHAFNDFHHFYLAAKLVAEGGSPYDVAALRAIAEREGLSFVVGTGYSYPLPFALSMIPFTLLPFTAAALVFNGLGLAVFGTAVGVWLRWAHGRTAGQTRIAIAAVAAGAYPPIYGSIASGQANLVVFGPFALGTMLLLARVGPPALAGAAAVGMAAVVKIVPAILAVPLALAGRIREAVAIGVALAGSIWLASVVVPWATAGAFGLVNLLGPDAYFTNQSINGFVSRLVQPSDRSLPLLPGAFDPFVVATGVLVLFGLANLGLLWRARQRLREPAALGIALALSIVAATIGAPKNSFWNQTTLLVAVGLLLLAAAPDLRLARLDRAERWLLGAWIAGAVIAELLWLRPVAREGPLAALVTLAQSAALYGAIALWCLLARRLERSLPAAT